MRPLLLAIIAACASFAAAQALKLPDADPGFATGEAGATSTERAASPSAPSADEVGTQVDTGVADTASVEAHLPSTRPLTRRTPQSMRIAAAALHHVRNRPRGFRDDCSGFVEAVLHRAGLPITGSVAMIYERAVRAGAVHHHPRPHIGDLVFFHNTYDRNNNGRQDDLNTHIGVVVDVEPDGTILLAHRGSRRAVIRMNLDPEHLHTHRAEDGRILNSYLKRTYRAPLNWPLRLTSQNWAAFATVSDPTAWEIPSSTSPTP